MNEEYLSGKKSPKTAKYYNVKEIFEKLGCKFYIDAFKDNADRGIDDIFIPFVGEQGKGTFKLTDSLPVFFHESKFDGTASCAITIPDTETKCQQLSIIWLKAHTEEIASRANTKKARFDLVGQRFDVQACDKCEVQFKEIVAYLVDVLHKRSCKRTASLLCANGTFNLYAATGLARKR